MPKFNEPTSSKNTVVIAAVVVAVLLAGLGYFAWHKSQQQAIQEPTETVAQLEQAVTPAAPQPPLPEPQPETIPAPPVPTPLPFPEVTPAPLPTAAAEPCKQATDKLMAFFNHLDQQDYVAGRTLNKKSQEHFAYLAKKLYANPPVVTRETDDLFTILTNSAHFYRILGKDDLMLIKDVLSHEADNLEAIMADFYHWSQTEPTCDSHTYALHLPLNSLYEYAGFFLNTLGGQSYLFRRESKTRMLVKYYAVLIIDQANEKGLNRHGIDIRTPLRSAIEEMEVSRNLNRRDDYLDNLLVLKGKYEEKYGHN